MLIHVEDTHAPRGKRRTCRREAQRCELVKKDKIYVLADTLHVASCSNRTETIHLEIQLHGFLDLFPCSLVLSTNISEKPKVPVIKFRASLRLQGANVHQYRQELPKLSHSSFHSLVQYPVCLSKMNSTKWSQRRVFLEVTYIQEDRKQCAFLCAMYAVSRLNSDHCNSVRKKCWTPSIHTKTKLRGL
jgi:hypothetical protein